MNRIKLQNLLRNALEEDLGEADLTSEFVFPPDKAATGYFKAKEAGTLAGLDIIEETYRLFGNRSKVELYKKDGDAVEEGEIIAEAHGPARTLLGAERLVLNILQHMSGIATMTRRAVDLLGSEHTRICDTRKTLPGLRMLEKYAVRCGGGFNHRLGLYDGVMIKDNHIAFAGGISRAVEAVRSKAGHMVNIEVETESAQEVREAVQAGADIIMFDNCSPDKAAELVKLVPGHITTEISGGITLETLPGYRDCGVDYISLGMLTHTVKALDISFNLKGGKK